MLNALTNEERVLGYDARELSAGAPDWLEQRRHEYLLRPEVVKPLSTDGMVWSSVFEGFDASGRRAAGVIELPQWTGPIQRLWDSLLRLTAHLDQVCGSQWPPCRLIAITLLYGRCPAEERRKWDERIVSITPSMVGRDWELLGYDVSDEWLLSGLSNCGYTSEEVVPLRRRWAPHLNDHHLFTDPERANEFVAVSNERVEEHAPFYAYGIYAIAHPDRVSR